MWFMQPLTDFLDSISAISHLFGPLVGRRDEQKRLVVVLLGGVQAELPFSAAGVAHLEGVVEGTVEPGHVLEQLRLL